MHLAYENPRELVCVLNNTARKTAHKLGIDLDSVVDDFFSEEVRKHDIAKLMIFTGTLPTEDNLKENPQPVLVNILEAIRWGETYVWGNFLKELLG